MYNCSRNYHKEFKILEKHLNNTNSTFSSKIKNKRRRRWRRETGATHMFLLPIPSSSCWSSFLEFQNKIFFFLFLFPSLLSLFLFSLLFPFFFVFFLLQKTLLSSSPYLFLILILISSFLLLNPSSFFSFNFILIIFIYYLRTLMSITCPH